MPDDTLVELKGHFLTRTSLTTLGPRKWLDNFVILFTSGVMMEEEFKRTGVVSRFMFNSYFADKVIRELPMFEHVCHKPWTFTDFVQYHKFPGKPIYHLYECDLIFAPVVFMGHWACYVLNKHERKLHVLDSLEHLRHEDWYLLDLAMVLHYVNTF